MRREVLRAHLTVRLAHGDRQVTSRAYFSDGTVEQRINPGVADDESVPWEAAGHYDDLAAERKRLHDEGWVVDH